VFVPDEEAARILEGWLDATDPAPAGEAWPGWPAGAAAFGLLLPHGGGVCLRGFPEVMGQAVATRTGRSHPGVCHLQPDEAARLGLPSGPSDAAPRVVEAQGVPIVLTSAPRTSAAALWEQAFGVWWSRQAPAAARAAAAAWAPAPPTPQEVALATVEGRAAAAALQARVAGAEGERAARTLALLRRERRALWEEEQVAGERALEVLAGVPRYVGWRCGGEVPVDRVPDEVGRLAGPERACWSGALLCVLLDRLADAGGAPPVRAAHPWAERPDRPADWREGLAADAAGGLDAALEAHVRFDGGSRDDAALAAAQSVHGYGALLDAADERAAAAAAARTALVEQILRGPGTLLTFATGPLGRARVTPAQPAQAVNAGLLLYAAGARFEYADGTLLDCSGLALAEDRHGALLHVRVAGVLRLGADGAPLSPRRAVAFTEGLELRVGGVRAHAHRGTLEPIEGGWLLRLAPAAPPR
jgi:hypothetical protein